VANETEAAAMTLVPDVLRTMAGRFPDRTAVVVDGGASMTFAEWECRSNAIGRRLVGLGVLPGDRVAILVSNLDAIHAYITYMAAQKAGGVASPINPRLARSEVAHILGIAQPKVVVASDELLAHVDVSSVHPDAVPPTLVRTSGTTGVDRSGDSRIISWADMERNSQSTFQVETTASDLADLLFTSGTTGLPKGVASNHENLLSIPVVPSEREASFLHAAPLGTALGTYGTIIACLRLALTNICLPGFSTSRFACLIEERLPGWLLLVPAHAQLLRESGALEGVDTSSVEIVLCGTAPMPPEAFRWLASTFSAAMVMNAYSLTEAGDSACLMSFTDSIEHPGSVGKPIAGGAVRVVDDAGNDLPPNEVGELVLRIRRGRRFYFGDSAATDETWRNGWVHTGDVGYVDRDGYVYLIDRMKDLIIRGGYNVYSVEVENALHEHPAITEAAVLGVPHKILGQDVLAVACLKEGDSLDLDALREFLQDRLADYKQPHQLIISEVPLPRTALLKVDKVALRSTLGLDTTPHP
jgi:acyl-CoA synthetase (AMP-forming)/AMP-acid ligase II